MKNENNPFIKPRGINIIDGRALDFKNPEDIEHMMLDNNQCELIVRSARSKLTSKMKSLITNEINWLADDEADCEWAIYAGDKDINTIFISPEDDLEKVIQTLVLASSIFLVLDEAEANPLNIKAIQQGLTDYEAAVRKVGRESYFEQEDELELSEEDQEVSDYEDDLFTAVVKRKFELPTKCFNVFIVDTEKELIRKIK